MYIPVLKQVVELYKNTKQAFYRTTKELQPQTKQFLKATTSSDVMQLTCLYVISCCSQAILPKSMRNLLGR